MPRVTNMTPEQIAQVQQSFAKVAPIADEAAALFYSRLFEIAPELRPLFRGDMAEQCRKLMATLAIVVHGLTRLDAILPAASALAKRHVGYGVKADHYAPVGAALLWTLERGLGAHGRPTWQAPGPPPKSIQRRRSARVFGRLVQRRRRGQVHDDPALYQI
jgi:hemoglobin-like flavoprotein